MRQRARVSHTVHVNEPHPIPLTTRFALRTLPMGFNSSPPFLMSSVAAANVDQAQPEPSPCATQSIKTERSRLLLCVTAALLALYAVLAFSASQTKGVSFDEALQLAVGYNLWLNDDYRIEGANGDLIKRWATLPFLVTKPAFPSGDSAAWRNGSGYELGREFLFEQGNNPRALLNQGRAMNVALGVATGLLVFCAARHMFGDGGGLLALGFFAFSPSMLALGGIVSTDMSITLTLFAATLAVWRVLHRITIGNVLMSLGAVMLLVLAKPTALLILPVTAVMVVAKLAVGEASTLRWNRREHEIKGRTQQGALFAALALMHVVAGWVAIWAHYGFRYAASPSPGDPGLGFYEHMTADQVPVRLLGILAWIEQTRVLPEGFWRGIDYLLRSDDGLGAFMNGEWKLQGGWWTFFPYAIWVKTPPALLLTLAAAPVAWCLARRRAAPDAPRLYAATPHFALIGCYLAIAITEDINIGHRHVLPIYPSLYVLAGTVIFAWRWSRACRFAVIVPVAWLVIESCAVRPHYLAYFGPQAGGPENGYRRLVDSSLDWGMDLPGLKAWLETHDPGQKERLFLSYFGTDRPDHYGIRSTRLPSFMPRRNFRRYALAPGYYAISASMLQAVHTAAFGPWNQEYESLYRRYLDRAILFDQLSNESDGERKLLQLATAREWAADYDRYDQLRLARLCAWLRQRGEPPHRVGHTLFIWKLSFEDLQQALFGPPPELANAPAQLRRYRVFKDLAGGQAAAQR